MHFGQSALFKTGFGAVHMGANHLKRQCSVDKNNLAIGLVGYALGLQIKGFNAEPSFGQHVGGAIFG